MIELEKVIENALRVGIRAALQAASSIVPELATAKIIGFYLGDEDGGPAEDASGLHVGIKANPNGSAGYIPSYGLEPQRTLSIDMMCVSQPDGDTDRVVHAALYNTVRSVFESVPTGFTLPAGVSFGGLQINQGGSADLDEGGQISGFTVEMKVSL
jgi:hypothetical protein